MIYDIVIFDEYCFFFIDVGVSCYGYVLDIICIYVKQVGVFVDLIIEVDVLIFVLIDEFKLGVLYLVL